MSSSFFLKGKPRSDKKRKFGVSKNSKNVVANKKVKEDLNEEVVSDDEEQQADSDSGANFQFSDEEHTQTPQDKRLRLAKKYLEEIGREEQSRAEDKALASSVSQRLTEEYLDSVGKFRKNVADKYTGYDEQNVKILKHKLQKLSITCICLSTDNKYMFSGSKTPFVVKWDLNELKAIGSLDCSVKNPVRKDDNKNRPQILAMALSSDVRFLVIAAMGNAIQVWCPITLNHLHTLDGHRDTVTALVFRKDTHQLYSASKDRSVKVWSLDDMAYIESLFGHQSSITGIDALSRERAITSGGCDCTIRIWKIAEESQLIYNGHRGSIENVKLINEDNFLSSGDDGSICVWSAMKKKPVCVKELAHGKAKNGEANWISAIATLINSDVFASGSCDGQVKLWKLGEHYRTITLLFEVSVKGFVNSLQFTNDGNRIIAAVGQEHRLGRWWCQKDANNSISIVKLDRNT